MAPSAAAGAPSVDLQAELAEEAVFHAMRAAEERGDPRAAAWAREREEVYRAASAERVRRFAALARRWVRELELLGPIEEALEAAPHVRAGVGEVLLRRVTRTRDEGSEVYRADSGGVRLVVTVCAERLAEPELFREHVLSEILLADDMLDPAFGYRAELPAELADDHARRELVRDRLRALWQTRTRGRLARILEAGAELPPPPRAFRRAFASLEEDARERLFEEAWAGSLATYAAMLWRIRVPSPASVHGFASAAVSATPPRSDLTDRSGPRTVRP